MFWDGERWIDERLVQPSAPRAKPRPHRRLALLLILAAVVVPQAVGLAAPFPKLTSSPETGTPGDEVTVSGSNLPARTGFQLLWDGSASGMPSGRTGSGGRFKLKMTIPVAPAGTHRVTAVAVDNGSSKGARDRAVEPGQELAATSFTVSPPPTPAPVPTATTPPAPIPSATVAPSTPAPATSPTPEPVIPTPTAHVTAAPTPTPPPTPAPARILVGLGPEADGAIVAPLVADAPVRMLSSWYNGPGDLSWMSLWSDDLIPQAYAAGRPLHLIVFSPEADARFDTPYGPACGRPYPFSKTFAADMQRLAEVWGGPAAGPPLYVTMFSEVQTYPCTDNAWNPDPETNAYYRALLDSYADAVQIFHSHAPNAKVSLGWGGWQARWDAPAIGGGRSMFQYFGDAMRASDFQSFQAMQLDSNLTDIKAMTKTLAQYGPVMLAHYHPDNNGSQATLEADLGTIFSDAYLAEVTGDGLFAFSFMDDDALYTNSTFYESLVQAIRRHAI